MKSIDWTKPVITKAGSEVKIYEVFYGRYLNGAYYEPSEDVWYVCSWDSSGKYSDRDCALDLVNEK